MQSSKFKTVRGIFLNKARWNFSSTCSTEHNLISQHNYGTQFQQYVAAFLVNHWWFCSIYTNNRTSLFRPWWCVYITICSFYTYIRSENSNILVINMFLASERRGDLPVVFCWSYFELLRWNLHRMDKFHPEDRL